MVVKSQEEHQREKQKEPASQHDEKNMDVSQGVAANTFKLLELALDTRNGRKWTVRKPLRKDQFSTDCHVNGERKTTEWPES